MNAVLVEVPCRRFNVVVKLGPPGGVGHLESLLLRRLGLGPATLEEVASLFSLPESLVLDRIVALVRLGLIALQPGEKNLYLGEAVARAMEDPAQPVEGWQEKLGLGGNVRKEVELYREMVSGTVFARPRIDNTRWQHRLPPSLDLPTVDEIPKPMLLAAASSKLREERTGVRKLRAFDVTCAGGAEVGSQTATPEAYCSIVVEVVGYNLDGDQPIFSVVGPSSVSRRVRDAIADGISSLEQRRLVSPLVQALRANATGENVDSDLGSRDPETAIKSLQELIAGTAPDLTYEAFEERHQVALAAARDIDDLLNIEAAHEGQVQLLIGAAAHRRLLLDALREGAKYQLVLATPRASSLARDEEMKEALVAAVSRGIRVHLLWGTAGAKFEDEFAQLHDLVELLRPQEQKVGGLFVSSRLAALNTSAFACDLGYVVVGGAEWFSQSPGTSTVGILLPSIESADVEDPRKRVPTAVVETVQALRQACPEATFRRVITADTVLDGGREIVRPRSPMEFPSAPGEVTAIGLKIWKDDWNKWLSDLASTRSSDSRTARLVPRGGHRRLLVRGLQEAQRRIILMSPRLGDGALGAAIEPYVLAALKRGVEITFAHRDILPRDDLTQRLRDYRRQGLRTTTCDVDGSFVVCDDRAIVGSFRFGTSDGERGALELGFDIRDPDVAATLVELATRAASLTSSE